MESCWRARPGRRQCDVSWRSAASAGRLRGSDRWRAGNKQGVCPEHPALLLVRVVQRSFTARARVREANGGRGENLSPHVEIRQRRGG